MQSSSAKFSIALTLAFLALAACTKRGDTPLSMLGEDDDAICRANNVAPGSSEYAACRRNRDAIRGAAAARADKSQRELGQFMVDNPTRPQSGF